MYRVLLLCKNGSLLSPIAGVYFRKFAGELPEVYTAGVCKVQLDPLIVDILKEDNKEIDIPTPYQLDELRHIDFDYILTLDQESREESLHLPSRPVKYHYDFDLLIPLDLTKENKEEVYKRVRDKIKNTVRGFVREHFADAKPA